ncbi:hypothetical protein DRO97_05125 [Archaeoglobales archaeon]|nr:MAG: hypothetical protein DRO97_05125 [Archaeoglobales archaeon]
MPTQEEVLQAIKEMGCATYKQLKDYFKMDYQGNSNLPQRIKALERRGLIAVCRLGGKTIFLPKDVNYTDEEIMQFFKELGVELRGPGRPEGSIEYRDESLNKLLRFIKENGIVSFFKITRSLNWEINTINLILNIYLNY